MSTEPIKKLLLVLGVILFSSLCWSQADDPLVDNWPSIKEVREAVTLRWEPAGKNVKLILTGYETLKLNLADFSIDAGAKLEGVQHDFAVQRKKDYFLISNPKEINKLKLKIKVKNKDSFNYNLDLK